MPANGCTREPAIEVTLTTEPLAALSSSSSPRASMIGAKKFTWKMWCQSSREVSIEPSRLPPAALGEIAALLTSACSSPCRRLLVSAIACSVFSGSDEIDLDVIFRPGFPRTVFRKRMPRTGNDAPAGGGKTLHRGMADAAACSGEQECTARLVGRRRHMIYLAPFSFVMRGLDPRIHADAPQASVFAKVPWKRARNMDRRVKPGNDEWRDRRCRRDLTFMDTAASCSKAPPDPRA